jgi:DNA topoisomerase VI subunit B
MSERAYLNESRTSENFSEGGLVNNTSQPKGTWGRYVVKELLDNSLDYADELDIAPELTVDLDLEETTTVGGGYHTNGEYDCRGVTVSDNGPGIPDELIERIFREIGSFGGTKRNYALPTRGNQGNALMTILGIQYLCGSPLSF